MLHIARSSYSFLRGYGKPAEFAERVAKTGGTLVAADYCSTWGHVEWAKAGVRALGVTLPAVKDLEKDPRHGLVTLVADDSEGLQNLYAATTQAFKQFYHRPRLTWEQVEALKSQNVTAYLDHALNDEIDLALAACEGNFLLKPRYSVVPLDHQGIRLIEACDARYPTASDKEAYQLVNKMTRTVGEVEGNPTHVLYDAEWRRLMLQQGYDVVPGTYPPRHEHDAGLPQAGLLTVGTIKDLEALCEQQPRFKLVRDSDTYRGRYDQEIKLIEGKGFASYFLFVADLVGWAKARMLVGPGRGSAGGSLVCFILGITDVDPIKYGTLFERFIDPGRPDLPDIDVDFPDHKRDGVFEYLREKYGADKVARVGTLTEFGGKSVLNDIARVYTIPFQDTRAITSLLDGFSGATYHLATVKFALEHADEKLIEKYPEFQQALLLDERPRNPGIHAAGVIVTQEPVTHFGTVNQDGVLSLDLKSAEAVGLMKMDALVLKTLSVLEQTLDAAGVPWSTLLELGYNDPDVWDLLNRDKVAGIFQFEGAAVRGLLKRVQVTCFDDLSALTSLARPGPLMAGAADDWIERKNGAPWASLIPELDSTFGLIVYQEQAMAIVREIAGFDVVDVNGFRRAIGKKDPVKLASYKERFIAAATPWFAAKIAAIDPASKNAKGVKIQDLSPSVMAEEIWHDMEEFGSYAFNLAHAVAYSMLSYWTAWAKTNYPLEHACAYLNYADEDHCRAFIREYGPTKLSLLDVENSAAGWSIVNGRLTGGFKNIKGVGDSLAAKFVAKREKNPDTWKSTLTNSQLKLLNGDTVYDDLAYFEKHYKDVYDDPAKYKLTRAPMLIADIPTSKGTYLFLGRLTKMIERKDTQGRPYALLFFSDDSGEMPCTVSKYDYDSKYRTADNGRNYFKDGHAYAVYGTLPNSERRWAFIDSVRKLHAVDSNTDSDSSGASGAPQGAGGSTNADPASPPSAHSNSAGSDADDEIPF